jgi:E3 ubiquitin-protein ligase FANCL
MTTKTPSSDLSDRQHIVYIDLPEGDRIYPLDVTAELPCEMPKFNVKTDMLAVIAAVRELLNEHQKLFDELDHLDAHSWILDPVTPNRRHTHRRLALGHHCSLHLEIKHTKNPCEAPDLQLFGAESRIAKWRKAISRNMTTW